MSEPIYITQEQFEQLQADVQSVATAMSEIDQGLVQVMVGLNATHHVLVEKKIVEAADIVAALKNEFEKIEKVTNQAMEAAQAKVEAVKAEASSEEQPNG